MKTNGLTVPRSTITKSILAIIVGLTAFALQAQSGGRSIHLQDGLNAYNGTEDFYTYLFEGGVFNSKTDLDDQTLKISPVESDTKAVMRFKAIPLSRANSGRVSRVTLVLTFKKPAQPDTIMVHNLNSRDIWNEYTASYNSINGTAPWSGADGKLIDAWTATDGTAVIVGSEQINSKLVIEFHPSSTSARKALLDSWLDGGNQGFVIRGISGHNEFYSSDAYNIANRPELIIEF